MSVFGNLFRLFFFFFLFNFNFNFNFTISVRPMRPKPYQQPKTADAVLCLFIWFNQSVSVLFHFIGIILVIIGVCCVYAVGWWCFDYYNTKPMSLFLCLSPFLFGLYKIWQFNLFQWTTMIVVFSSHSFIHSFILPLNLKWLNVCCLTPCSLLCFFAAFFFFIFFLFLWFVCVWRMKTKRYM